MYFRGGVVNNLRLLYYGEIPPTISIQLVVEKGILVKEETITHGLQLISVERVDPRKILPVLISFHKPVFAFPGDFQADRKTGLQVLESLGWNFDQNFPVVDGIPDPIYSYLEVNDANLVTRG